MTIDVTDLYKRLNDMMMAENVRRSVALDRWIKGKVAQRAGYPPDVGDCYGPTEAQLAKGCLFRLVTHVHPNEPGQSIPRPAIPGLLYVVPVMEDLRVVRRYPTPSPVIVVAPGWTAGGVAFVLSHLGQWQHVDKLGPRVDYRPDLGQWAAALLAT